MNILFYSPFNNRSRDTETLMLAFKAQGHHIISLSQAEGKFIHPFLNERGIVTHSYVVPTKSTFIYFLKHVFFFIRFCRKNKIDVVYSHLESASFVAALAQFFVSAIVYVCRHHIDEAALQGFNRSVYYKLTYQLARKIIVVSKRAADYMVNVEGISRTKIIAVNLAYDFELYANSNPMVVEEIKRAYPAVLRLLTVGRLTRYKRIEQSIELVAKLVQSGVNTKLLILGRGEEMDRLVNLVKVQKLEEHVFFIGFVHNVIDYLSACDYLVHPSILESSCVIVKEAGLVSKPAIVCTDVGDFDEYIVSGVNGYIVNRDSFVEHAYELILKSYQDKERLAEIGHQLSIAVRKHFSIENVISEYDRLNVVK